MPRVERATPPGDLGGAATDVLATEQAGPAAIRGGFIRVVSYAAGVLLTVGSAALLFRHLGVVDAGHYVTVLSLVTLAGGVTDAGITAIGMRELAVREGHERDAVVRALLGLRIVLTALGGLGAVAFAALAGYEPELIAGTAVAAVGVVVTNLQSTLTVSLMTGLRLGLVSALDFLRQVLTVAAIVALVVAGADVLPFLAIPIPVGLVLLWLTARLVRSDIPVVPSFSWGPLKGLIRETLPFAVATAVVAVYFRLAIVIVSLVASGEETGYFGASFRIIEVLVIVPQLMVGAAFPIFARAARDDTERLAYGLQRVVEVSLIVGCWLALCLSLAAGLVIAIVAGPDFDPAADVLRIQSIALVASFVAAAWSYALLSLRRHTELLLMNLASLVTILVLTTVLANSNGAEGAAVATTAAEVMLALVGAAIVMWSARLRVELWPLAKVLVAAGLAAAAGGLPDVPDAAAAAIASVVFLAALLALRAFPDELLVELRRRRAPRPG